jgi:hypothetical protein
MVLHPTHAPAMGATHSIAHLPRRLLAAYEGAIPSPRRIYDLTLLGQIPAELLNGRWYYAENDEPKIAASLGLTRKRAPVARNRKAAADPAPQAAIA